MCFYTRFINWTTKFLPHLILRTIIAWQAWDFGLQNYKTSSGIFKEQMVMPFLLLSPDISREILIWLPLVGAIFLVIGFQVRLVAIGLLIIGTATILTKLPPDLLTNFVGVWHSELATVLSFKFDLLILVINLVLVLFGAGGISIDGITNWLACSIKARRDRKKRKADRKLAKQALKNRKKYSGLVDNQEITQKTSTQKDQSSPRPQDLKQQSQSSELVEQQDSPSVQQMSQLDSDDPRVVYDQEPPRQQDLRQKYQTAKASDNGHNLKASPKNRKSRIKIKENISDLRDVDFRANVATVN